MKHWSHLVRLTLLATLLAGTALSVKPVMQVHAGTAITVTTDDDDPATNVDTNSRCSLREAIYNANAIAPADQPYPDCAAGSGENIIDFTVDVQLIQLTSRLPPATDPAGLTIEGRGLVTIHGGYDNKLLAVQGGTLTLRRLNLSGGYSPDLGVGAAITNGVSGTGLSSTLIVDRSIFFFNNAPAGGAIYNDHGTLTVANSLFLQNNSDDPAGYGGAVAVNGGTVTLTNNTFDRNLSARGGDLFVEAGTVHLVNNIFANSQGGGNCTKIGGTVDGHHNLIENAATACGLGHNENGNILGVDPAFDATNFNGIALLSTSPAIDAGDDAACAASPVNNTSSNGLFRSQQGIHCDMGAYEYPQTLMRTYIVSTASQDGWVLESTATSSVGGSKSSAGSTIPIGDTAQKQQRVGIFSFDLAAAGLTAPQIAGVILGLKPAGYCGTTSPFPSLGHLLVDVRTGSFANNPALQAKDFQALATRRAAWNLDGTLTTEGWLAQELSPADFQSLNWAGVTQLRVRFAKGNNSNARADCLKIYSSEEPTHLVQPQLVVDYYVR